MATSRDSSDTAGGCCWCSPHAQDRLAQSSSPVSRGPKLGNSALTKSDHPIAQMMKLRLRAAKTHKPPLCAEAHLLSPAPRHTPATALFLGHLQSPLLTYAIPAVHGDVISSLSPQFNRNHARLPHAVPAATPLLR